MGTLGILRSIPAGNWNCHLGRPRRAQVTQPCLHDLFGKRLEMYGI